MDKGKLSAGADLLRLSTVGLNFVLCLFAGAGLGWGAQKLFHCGSWVVIVGFLFGTVAAYIVAFEQLRDLQSRPKDPPSPP